MADRIFPPWCRVSALDLAPVGNAHLRRSIYNQAASVSGLPGDKLRLGLSIENAYNSSTVSERASLEAFLFSLRGSTNPFWMPIPGYTGPRGSFPSTELLTNNTFANGITGWSTYISSIAVTDRVLRAKSSGAQRDFGVSQANVAITQYTPTVIRFFFAGSLVGTPELIVEGSGPTTSTTVSAQSGLVTTSYVPHTTPIANVYGYHNQDGMARADRYLDIAFGSVSRCFLVDNGPNLLTRSDEFDHANWAKFSSTTVTANATASPDGTSTADALVEWAATSNPQVTQDVTVSSAAADYSITICAKKGARDYLGLIMEETASGTLVFQTFNLNTGAVGASNATQANWANLRSFIRNLGDGWYACTIVGRKTNAATTIRVYAFANANDNGTGYAMSAGTSAIYLWRATLAQSSVPTRLVQSTSAAVAATAQTGNALYVKGGPASANSSLLAGDWVQIGDYPYKLIAPLDFDAAGLGYLQLNRPVRSSPADNAPVIVNNPMGRFVLANQAQSARYLPGQFADFEFLVEEALNT